MVLWLLLGCILLLLLVILLRTVVLREPPSLNDLTYQMQKDPALYEILSKAIGYKTISHLQPDQTNWGEFEGLIAHLAQSFPLCNQHRIKSRQIGDYNLLYHFEGESDTEPALLLAHLDVVDAKEDLWSQAPFKGTIDDDFLYGRGSFDCKLQVITILASFEALLTRKQKPKRSWYVAFGCDEECNQAKEGAYRIAQYLKDQDLHFSMILDEGGVVSKNYIKGFRQSIAVVGIAEKGYADISLCIDKKSGHSSTPSFPTALGSLCKALHSIERHQMPVHLTYPIRQMLYKLGKKGPFLYSLLFLNLWIFWPLIALIFKKNPTLNATIRSTVVGTVIQASKQNNVISKEAKAIINVRLLNGDTTQAVVNHIQKVCKEPSLQVQLIHAVESSKISTIENQAYSVLSQTISSVFPDALITPYLMLGATDARKYQGLSDAIYRFTPARMTQKEVDRMHAEDERISLENICLAKQFYESLLSSW